MQAYLEATGECVCKIAPRGTYGLEGWEPGERYRYSKVRTARNTVAYRIHAPATEPPYYEVATERAFMHFFSVLGAYDDST